MFKFILAVTAASLIGVSAAEAQQQHHTPRQVKQIVTHPHHHGYRVVRHPYTYGYTHTPAFTLYGTYRLYQQYGFAVVGYQDLAGVQDYCGQQGLQIVEVNPVQTYVVVRIPASYGWTSIQSFSTHRSVRFVEPRRHHR